MAKVIFYLSFLLGLTQSVQATTFTVTQLAGNAPWDSPTSNNGSFAGALLAVNAAGAGPHTIAFNLPAPYTIDIGGMTTTLAANSNITIDGLTQPGSVCNTAIRVGLDAGYATFSFANQTNMVLRGIRFNCGLVINGGSGLSMTSCFFGLNVAGTALAGAVVGNAQLEIINHSGATIGTATSCEGNVFSGRGASSSYTNALVINNSPSTTIQYNFFCTERTGATLLGYVSGSVILCQGGTGNIIRNNVIGGGVVDKAGIEINSGTNTNLTITQNKIGVNTMGVFFGSATSNQGNIGHGIWFSAGGTAANAQVTNNVVSANGQSGIFVNAANTGYTISDNIVGLPQTGIQGAQNYGNGFAGIIVKGVSTSNLTIHNNTVCKNGWRSASPSFQDETVGIILSGCTVPTGATVTISNNYVGVDRSFNLAGNIFTGIYLFQDGTMSNGVKANVQIINNVTGDNGETPGAIVNSHGIAVYNSNAFTITGNYIGVGPGGQNIGNSANGIEINTAANFTFANNQVAYNKGRRTSADAEACSGVMLFTASNGYVQNNNIYSNTNAGVGFVNNHGVVAQRGGGLLIGGTGAGEPNSINNNGTHGVFVLDGADNVEIRRNIISCNNSMGISLNIAGDPDTEASKGVGNASYGVPEGPTLATTGCPGAGIPGSGNANGNAPANSLVEVFDTPSCKTCTTGSGSLRGEASSYQQQVTATAGATWSATGVTGTVSITATSPTTTAVGGNNFRKTSRFSTCQTCSLPITLLYFNGQRNSFDVVLTWATAMELNNKEFTIERSENGSSFYPIGVVQGAGNSSSHIQYQFVDKQPLPGISYYRLKQEDVDGTQSFSAIIAVSQKASSGISLFPNPAQSDVSIVLLNSDLQGPASVRVYNVLGQEVLVSLCSSEELRVGIHLELSALPQGTYTVKLITSTQEWVEQLIKK
ncbi:MAG: hypothetical protein K0R51_3139 [Cytophagaceae bacterium]|jgi:hypothetical protein|nr:hypothetical protein [Cytophagaceae bacterium]